MTLTEVKLSADPRRAFDSWFLENRLRVAKACQSIWYRFHGRKPTADELEDLVQEAAITAWLAVDGFRWICPACRAKKDSPEKFQRHARRCKVAAPLVTIERRVFYQQGAGAQRYSRLRAYGGDMLRRRSMIAQDLDDVLRPQSVPAFDPDFRTTALAMTARQRR